MTAYKVCLLKKRDDGGRGLTNCPKLGNVIYGRPPKELLQLIAWPKYDPSMKTDKQTNKQTSGRKNNNPLFLFPPFPSSLSLSLFRY